MQRKSIKIVMMCGAAWVVPTGSATLFAGTAQAQTICAPGLPNTIECLNGVTTTATGTVNAGTIVVNGPGLVASSIGNLVADVTGNITTAAPGAPAVSLVGLGDLTFDLLGTAATTGAGSTGVVLVALGDIDAAVDAVTTAGLGSDALVATAVGDLSIVTGTIATLANNSDGLVLNATNVTAVCGTVTTVGDNSIAINATATAALDLTCATVQTTGAASDGVILSGTDITADLGAVSTDGIGSDAIIATATGDLDILSDTVVTLANDSGGLVLTGENITAVCGTVTTAGDNSIGIEATATAVLDLTCATVQTTGAASDGLVLVGNDIDVDVGTVTTDGIGSDALVATATGDLTVTSDTIATLQDDSDGLVLTAENITVICGNVTTAGNNSIGIDANATASVDLQCASVGTEGNVSPGVDITGDGPITVVIGPVDTGGDDSPGIIIDGGDEPVAVTCGDVVTSGNNSPGVSVTSEGLVTINCDSVLTDGDNSDGIQVDGGSGNVSVTVGPVTTDGVDSDGIDVITDTGDITIVAGPVTVTGPASDGIRAVGTACADININATSDVLSTTSAGIFASTLCTVNITTQPGASVTGATAGIDATSGTGTTITLNDSVQATAGPAIDVDGAAALITVNAGGSIIGRIDLTDNNDVLNNAGTINVIGTSNFGGGVDVITNTGTVSSTNGNGVLANCETFNNSGTLTMIDGAANDTLTICGNYVGTGAANLGIDVGGTAAGLTADELIIIGNASGSTDVNIALLPGSGIVDSDGVLVVDAGTSAANAFTLGTTNNTSPLLAYALEQRGADYFLTSGLTAAAFDPLVVPGFATDLWYPSANEVFAQTTKPATTAGISFWGEGYISRERAGDKSNILTVDGVTYDVNNRTRHNRHGLQAGIDYGFGGVGRVGLTGGYLWAKANGSGDADLKAKGWNIGIYGQFGGITGFHGEFLAKRDRYKADFRNGVFDGTDFRIRSSGIDGSLGFRFGMGTDGNIDVAAGLSHVRTKVGDIEAFGFTYDTNRMTSTRGRAGIRGTFGGSLAPYVAGTVYHEFKGNGNVDLFDGANTYELDTHGKGTWMRLEGGLNGNDGPGPILAAWGDFGDRKGFGLRAGFRFGGGIVETAPPPPPVMAPPPPPAPPATQTCADGSVILATDMCPASPPPPPPPAPEPERG